MTKYIQYIILVLILSGLYSCQKDIIGEETSQTSTIPEPFVTVESTVFGLVMDASGAPLADVSVTHRGDEILTDSNGYFHFESRSSRLSGGYLTFEKENYFKNYKFFIPIEVSDQNFLRVTMIEQNLSETLISSQGGDVTTNGGAKVNFKPNSFANADGSLYVGNVNVYAHWYDPTSNDLGETMPGDLRGIDEGGQRVQLATYGMMGVELKDDADNELNLASGQTATLTFPLPESLAGASPESIPTWSFNEDTGSWIEEGLATHQDNGYVAEVSHFSFWNIDAKFPVINFCVTLESDSGEQLPNLNVIIRIRSSGLTASGMTNQRGEVCGKIPSDQALLLFAVDDCNDILFSEEIGPFSDDVDLGSIVVNPATSSFLTVRGQLTCNGVPVTNGYALLTTNDGIRYSILTDNDGNYETELISCNDTKVTIQGIDVNEAGQSEAETFSQPSNPLVVDQEVCNQASEEFIAYAINGIPILINNPSATIVNGVLSIRGTQGDNGIKMNFLNPVVGVDLPIDSIFAEVINQTNSEFVWCNNSSTLCDPSGAAFTEVGNSVGDFVIGSFESEVNSGKTLTGNFKIEIDEILEFNTLIVDYWEDTNADGIQDSDEALWSFFAGPQPTIDLIPNSGNTILDTDFGLQTYTGIEMGNFFLEVSPPVGYAITDKVSGGNNIDALTGLSDEIIFSSTRETQRIKVGFKPTQSAFCFYELREPASCTSPGLVSININNTDQLSYNLFADGNLIESNSFSGGDFELWLEADRIYEYQILDDQGQELCSEDFTIDSEILICTFYPLLECDNGIPSVISEFDCGFSGTNLTFTWSNGFATPVPRFLDEGTYSLTVTDNAGCIAIGELEVNFEEFFDIQGVAWVDNPMFNDNVLDPNDDLYEGLMIRLFDVTGIQIEETLSNAQGQYQFSSLQVGDYYIECDLPANFSFLEMGAGIIASQDSDIDPLTGRSRTITVGDCNRNNDIGIGLKEN